MHLSADKVVRCGPSNEDGNQDREDDSPRDERPEQQPENPEPDAVEWRKVNHAVVFARVTVSFGGGPVLHKQENFVRVGFRNAEAVNGDEDMLAGLEQHDLIAAKSVSISSTYAQKIKCSLTHMGPAYRFRCRIWSRLPAWLPSKSSR